MNFSRDFQSRPRYNGGDEEQRIGLERLRVPDRMRVVVSMQSTDELVDQDHPVRLVWRVVCGLDLGRFHEPIKAREGAAGRDSTDPRLLVALWLYAATEGVGSARELARLCGESRAYMWLCGRVTLNHHTLSDFRVGHGPALDELFTQVIASLVEEKLVSVHRIAQDGTRVRACRRGRDAPPAAQAAA